MKTIVFDTETTGKAALKLPYNHSTQPHLVQLGWVVLDGKRQADIQERLVNPGVPIPADATRIHGITDEMVAKAPTTRQAIMEFLIHANDCDRIVAHNMQFDRLIMRAAIARHKIPCIDMRSKEWLCTMLGAMPVLKIPGRYQDYKWPSLDEAYRALVDKMGFSGAHGASADALAASKVFLALLDMGAFSERVAA